MAALTALNQLLGVQLGRSWCELLFDRPRAGWQLGFELGTQIVFSSFERITVGKGMLIGFISHFMRFVVNIETEMTKATHKARVIIRPNEMRGVWQNKNIAHKAPPAKGLPVVLKRYLWFAGQKIPFKG
jgi:hypothetical protein